MWIFEQCLFTYYGGFYCHIITIINTQASLPGVPAKRNQLHTATEFWTSPAQGYIWNHIFSSPEEKLQVGKSHIYPTHYDHLLHSCAEK